MFGLFKKKKMRGAEDVMSHAITLLGRLAPTASVDRDELVLRVAYGRGFEFDLGPYIKMAKLDLAWEEPLDLHLQVSLRAAIHEPAAAPESDELRHAVRLILFEDLPAELQVGDWAVEPIAGRLWAMYGEEVEDGFTVMRWADLISDDRHHLMRWLCSVRTLNRGFGEDGFTNAHISVELAPGVFTNEHHIQIGAAMLMPPTFWRGLMQQHGTDSIVLALPAASRLFWTSRPELISPLRALVDNALAIEEDALSPELYRFDGTSWSVLDAHHAQA